MSDDLKNKILVTAITNPFNPYESRIAQWVECQDGLSISEYARQILPLMPEDFDVEFAINGRRVVPEEFITLVPVAGDNIVFCPVPQGGDDDKGLIRTIAMFVVMIVATYISYGAGAGWFGAAEGSWQAIAIVNYHICRGVE